MKNRDDALEVQRRPVSTIVANSVDLCRPSWRTASTCVDHRGEQRRLLRHVSKFLNLHNTRDSRSVRFTSHRFGSHRIGSVHIASVRFTSHRFDLHLAHESEKNGKNTTIHIGIIHTVRQAANPCLTIHEERTRLGFEDDEFPEWKYSPARSPGDLDDQTRSTVIDPEQSEVLTLPPPRIPVLMKEIPGRPHLQDRSDQITSDQPSSTRLTSDQDYFTQNEIDLRAQTEPHTHHQSKMHERARSQYVI